MKKVLVLDSDDLLLLQGLLLKEQFRFKETYNEVMTGTLERVHIAIDAASEIPAPQEKDIIKIFLDHAYGWLKRSNLPEGFVVSLLDEFVHIWVIRNTMIKSKLKELREKHSDVGNDVTATAIKDFIKEYL
jgi:hypothetical protein